MDDDLMKLHLSMCVPLRIQELQTMRFPLEDHLARIRPYAWDIAECGDQLLFRGKRTAELMNKMVDALAVMALLPGGVMLFGLHFEAQFSEATP